MDWLDRISRRLEQAPVVPFAPGQWRYCGGEPLTLRDATARPGDVLIPDPSGRCHVPTFGPIRCDPHYVPDDDALRALRVVGDGLKRLDAKSWNDWTAETPVLPALDDALDETPFEKAVSLKLGYLEAACQRPRTDLRIGEERLLVARCKRASARAPGELAARSEDWEARTLWEIRPRRVLGVVREELYDIYPNRITVALVDNLDLALIRRLHSVSRIVQLLKQRENYQRLLENSQNYRRAIRILELWRDALEDDRQLKHARAVKDRILRLRRRVLALKDTRLYQEIGGRRGRLQLRMTNVFTNDDVYRRVAELWQAWEDHIRSLSVDPEVRWRQEQDAADGFERFLFLVIVRALGSLGYSPRNESQAVLVNGTADWKLDGPAGEIVLQRNRSCITVGSVYAEDGLKFVSLPAMLEAAVSVGEWIATVRERSAVVVALPADEPRSPEAARVRLHSLSDGACHRPMFVAAAPWDLESVERVARIIRWHAWSALYARYPVAVELPETWTPPEPAPRWIRFADRSLNVIRPPAAHELTWVALQVRIKTAAAFVAEAKAKLAACSAHDKRKRLRIKHELDGAARDWETDRQLWAEIQEALRVLSLLRVCPVCRTECDQHHFDHTNNLFRAQCSECGSAWGRRTCHACGQPLAFLDFPGNSPSEDLLEAERRYGADVLAIPLADHVYVCPNCASRTDGGVSSWNTRFSAAGM